MINKKLQQYGLSGNALKIIACLSMIIDHVGAMILPDVAVLRIIGRVAFPIFAFMISEGCAYTRNKLRYFLSVFLLGVLCQLVYYVYADSLTMCILITFSLSILVIYAIQNVKESFIKSDNSFVKKVLSVVILFLVIAFVYLLNKILKIDYGFAGCLAPAFASIFKKKPCRELTYHESFLNRIVNLLVFSLGLVILALKTNVTQYYALAAIPILALYQGRRGRLKMKYFFYIFYPLHLVAIEFIGMLLS